MLLHVTTYYCSCYYKCTAKNNFLIKKKILNLRNYFLKRETDFLNKKNDS